MISQTDFCRHEHNQSKIRDISDEENVRLESWDIPGVDARILKRDPVEPEPVGTIILYPLRIVGYDQDCDGSLMARLDFVENSDNKNPLVTHVGLYPNSALVVTEDELKSLLEQSDDRP